MPLLEPATEAQEGAAAAQAEAAEGASEGSSSESWELVDFASPSSSSRPAAATGVSQERRDQARSDLLFGQALRNRRLFERVLQIPFIPQLVHRHWRFFIVWEVPGRSDWSGVHFSFGDFCSTQIRLHAVAALPHLSAADAYRRIRWCRALGCTQAQLESAYRQEARLPAQTTVRFYWWRS